MNSNSNSVNMNNNISELHSAMQSLYANQEYSEIIKMFLEISRIRLIVISEQINDAPTESIKQDKASVLLKKLSDIIYECTGFNLMSRYISPLSAIEDKIVEFARQSVYSKVTFRKDVLFLTDLYYMLKTFNPKCLFPDGHDKSDETIDWIEKVKGIDSQLIEALPQSLKFISPIATYIKNNTHKKIPFAKALPFVKNKQQSAIPESVGTVLKEFMESKFREEIDSTEREFDRTKNLNTTISKIHFLESTRKTLSKSLEVSLPKDSLRHAEFAGIQAFLKAIMIICMGIIALNIVQIAMLPQGAVTFSYLMIVPVAIMLADWWIQNKVR